MDWFRPLTNPHAAAERLAEWADQARQAGRVERADKLLLLAWEAYDRPARTAAVFPGRPHDLGPGVIAYRRSLQQNSVQR